MGELKNITGSGKLPYGTLALGTEGIKDAISGFDDAYVFFYLAVSRFSQAYMSMSSPRRKSDIENERLPPDLFDAEEAKAFLAQHAHSQSLPETASLTDLSLSSSGSIEASIEAVLSSTSLASSQSSSSLGGPSTPTSPTSSPSKVPFRGRHGRQASLGTTRTSPSTRRRSLESTISMIQEALDGKDLEAAAAGSGGYDGGLGSG